MGRLAPLATARLPFELAQDRLDAAASIRPRATRRATQKRDRFAPPCAKRVAGTTLEPHARSREVRDEERQRLTMAPVSEARHETEHHVDARLHGENFRRDPERFFARADRFEHA